MKPASAPTPSGRRADLRVFLAAALLAACAVAAYWRTFGVPFVFDDLYTIVNNPSLRHWSTAFRPPLESTSAGRPVLNLSLALNYAIGGTSVRGYHGGNLLIHVLAGLTLFGIVRRTLGRTGPAFTAALLWFVHPLNTEAVTYVVQRAESLMGLFYLVTLYCFIRGAEFGAGGGAAGSELRNAQSGRQDRSSSGSLPEAANELRYCELGRPEGARRVHPFGTRLRLAFSALRAPSPATLPPSPNSSRVKGMWFGLSWASCLLGMGTKEVMVTAPVVVLMYDRTFVAGTFRAAWRRRRAFYVALCATWIPLILLVLSNHGRNRTAGFGGDVAWWKYALTQFVAIAHYLRLCFWPHPLVFDYGIATVGPSLGLIPPILLVSVLAGATIWALVRQPRLGFLGAFFFMVLAPSSSVVPVASQTMAEHRMYLPLAAVVVLVVVLIYRWLASAALPVCLVLGGALLATTWRRNEVYGTPEALWAGSAANAPANPRAHEALGDIWLNTPGRLEDAIGQYRESLRLYPDNPRVRTSLGYCLKRLPGHSAEALGEFREALREDPDYPDAHFNLGNLWAVTPGRLGDAVAEYREAVRLRPDFPQARINLAIALAQAPGGREAAEAQVREVLRLHPEDEAARRLLSRFESPAY